MINTPSNRLRSGARRALWTLAILALTLTSTSAAVWIVDGDHPQASDDNPGTRAAPLKTISSAAAQVQPGDEVIVRPGIYRERVRLTISGRADAPIVFRSEEPHAAVIRGSDVLSAWEPAGEGVWAAPVSGIQPNIYRGGNPQWIYLDGLPLERADHADRLIPGSFHLDLEAQRVLVAPPGERTPEDALIEFSRREGLIHSAEPIDDIHILGFTIEHNADWFRGIAALRVSGRRWLVADNQIRWASYYGLAMQRTTDCVVRDNRIEWIGCKGVGGGPNLRLVFENNTVRFNNWRRFNWGNEGGGSKWVVTLDSIFRGNTVAYNFGPGLWHDGVCEANLFEGNICHDNAVRSLFTEINWHDIIQHNLIYNNREGGITVSHSPGTLVRRNVVFNNGIGIGLAGRYARRGDHGGANMARILERVQSIPGIEPLRITQWESNYLKYWVAPAALPLNNCLVWENLVFDNRINFTNGRDYRNPSAIDPFVTNLSDHNIIWAAEPRDHFAVGWQDRYEGLEDWRTLSGRDLNTRVADPRDPDTTLPEWAAVHRAHWDQPFRSQSEMLALQLRLVESPMAQIAFGRMLRSSLLEPVSLEDDHIRAFRIEVEGERTLVVWTTQAGIRRDLRLKLDQTEVTVENGFMTQQTRSLPRGAIDFPVSYNPTYLRGIGDTVIEAPVGIVRAPAFNLADSPVSVAVVFRQEGEDPDEVQARFIPGPGYKVETSELRRTLQPGERWETTVTLIPDGTVRRGASHVRMEAVISGETIRRMAVFAVGEGDRVIPRIDPPPTLDGSLDDWGDIVTRRPPLALLTEAGQLVDGDRDAWQGPEDLSARVFGAWTPEALYLAIAVTDDQVQFATPDGHPDSFDRIEVCFDGRAADMQWQPDFTRGCYRATISPMVDGATLIRPIYAARQVAGVEAASTKTDDGYVIEMRIPLTARNFPAGAFDEERPVRLSVLVRDADIPPKVLGWGATIHAQGRLSDLTTGWETLLLGP